MTDDLKKSHLRALQYWYVDGTFEFSLGGLCLVLAAYFYFQDVLAGTLAGGLLTLLLILVIFGGGWLINRLIVRIKERLTFPRTGYVSYRREYGLKRSLRIALGSTVGALVSGFIAWLVISRPAALNWMPALSGVLLGFATGLFAWRTALARFYLLALLSLALGIVLSVLGLKEWLGVTAYYAGMGIVLLLTGACVLRTYLHRNPGKKEEPA